MSDDLRIIARIFHCLLCCALLAGTAVGQSVQPESPDQRTKQVAEAIAKVKAGKFALYHVELIGEARAVEAIPDLEKQFTLKTDTLDKAKIAQVLLSLGDTKNVYWDYLEQLVKSVLENGAPSPVRYDAEGNHIPSLSPEFIAWAQAHGQVPGEAAQNAVYIWPGYLLLIGASADSRALPWLQRAMSSPNAMIQSMAAQGLAEMHDETSVPLIIAKCKEAPSEISILLAESLLYFDDPEAQKAFDTYVPKELAKALRESKKAGRDPIGVYPLRR